MKPRERSDRGVYRWVAVIGILVAPARGLAQDATEAVPASAPAPVAEVERERPRLVAVRTTVAPNIDGDLRDAAWERAAPTAAFTQKFPDEAHPPSERTELRVLYDDDALYIAFDCVQTATPVKGRLARRDRQVESDWAQVAIDDGASAYEFSVNAAGVLGDGVRFNDTDYSPDWDGVWDAQVGRNDRGWSAELRIPLRIFRHSIGAKEWGFQARRYISERQETDEWAYIPRSMAGEVSHYGWLSGISDVHRSNPLELLPYVSGGATWLDMKPGRALSDFGYRATAGLDLALRIGKDLTLDASFNPDFAQVEADRVVLNLTTYETFVPEKRPFFVNGMALFQLPRMELFPTPQTLFYTRRIGSVPGAPALEDGATANAPEPSTIYAAAKLTGQLASGVTAGFVSALTGRNDVTAESPDMPSRDALAEPLALAGVARVKVEVGGGANLGVLATALRRFEPDNAYPTMTLPDATQGQLCPDGSTTALGARCFHDAYAAGVDGNWRSSSGAYVVVGQAFATSIQNGPPRTFPDGTVIKSGDTSPSGRVYLAKEGGHWLGSVEIQGVGRRVDHNDLGYMQRQNLVRTLPFLAYRTLEPFWEIAETKTSIYVSTRDNLDGVALLRGYYSSVRARFKNFWIAQADVYRYNTRFEDREIGDGTALQRPGANGLDVYLSTDPRRELAASFSTESLFFLQGGGSFTFDGELTYQPQSQLELQLLPQLILASGESRFIPGARAPGEPRLLFGKLRAQALGGTLRASYTFTNRLTLQLYSQLLAASKHYSNFRTYEGPARQIIRLNDLTPTNAPMANPDIEQTTLNISAVLRWEFRPGSTLFLVYTRAQTPDLVPEGEAKLDFDALRQGPAYDALRLKLSYYWN
jgi:hypothetical protein